MIQQLYDTIYDMLYDVLYNKLYYDKNAVQLVILWNIIAV